MEMGSEGSKYSNSSWTKRAMQWRYHSWWGEQSRGPCAARPDLVQGALFGGRTTSSYLQSRSSGRRGHLLQRIAEYSAPLEKMW
eukprot:1273158-Pyramimonas_sp.AAC.2